MKIGTVTDSLGHLSFEEMLDMAAKLGIEGVEFNAANWTSAPHLNLKGLLGSASARQTFVAAVKRRVLEISALNANGNQLHPTEGDKQSEALYDTIRLAGELGVETVVLMSGLPEGAAGDKMPNWVVSSWPHAASSRAFRQSPIAKYPSPTTAHSTISGIRSRTCSAGSKIGGASTPAMTDARTPSSRPSASPQPSSSGYDRRILTLDMAIASMFFEIARS